MKSLTQKKIKRIGKKYNLLILVLFGSRANNKAKKDSDVDLAFYTRSPMKPKEELSIYEEFVESLEYEKIDLININTNHSPVIRKEIFFNGKPLFEAKEGLFTELKWNAWIDYIDFKKYEKKRMVLLKEKLKEAAVNA